MEVIWTQEALERLEDIQYYLAVEQKASQAAGSMISKIISRTPQISEMHFSGRAVPDYEDPKVREQLENPYRIIYLISSDSIYILSVMHQRQLLPKMRELKEAADIAIKEYEKDNPKI